MSSHAESIKVVVRVRPRLQHERQNANNANDERESDSVVVHSKQRVVVSARTERSFAFDRVFDHNSDTSEVYSECAQHVVDGVCDGYSGTILAYGQTCSGKTYTMGGLVSYAVEHIMRRMGGDGARVTVSFLEIYLKELRDLLSENNNNSNKSGKNKTLRIQETTDVTVANLTEVYVQSATDMLVLFHQGNKRRAQGATAANQQSSRSHALFRITLESTTDDDDMIKSSLTLVDLGDSERQKTARTKGNQLREGAAINSSLSVLGRVMRALGKRVKAPYRESPLTHILRPALGGNSRALLIATVSPCRAHADESLSTLKFACSATCVTNRVRRQVVISKEKLENKRLREQVRQLQLLLQQQQTASNEPNTDDDKRDDCETDRAEQNNIPQLLTHANENVDTNPVKSHNENVANDDYESSAKRRCVTCAQTAQNLKQHRKEKVRLQQDLDETKLKLSLKQAELQQMTQLLQDHGQEDVTAVCKRLEQRNKELEQKDQLIEQQRIQIKQLKAEKRLLKSQLPRGAQRKQVTERTNSLLWWYGQIFLQMLRAMREYKSVVSCGSKRPRHHRLEDF